ncbi:MAG: hypothetical protein GY861_03045 [bacterium]|nr:hypothetical protein [bacterium]
METRNAIIKSVSLTIADHGCLTMWLHLDYGGSGQGFGGFMLHPADSKVEKLSESVGACGHWVVRCLQIADVMEISDLAGKTIRVKGDHGGIDAIGHILKDDWFCPSEDFKDF